MPELTIVIPTYNEGRRIHESLKQIYSYLLEWGLDSEIIVVDDPSTDGTPKIVQDFAERNKKIKVLLIQSNVRLGKGGSLRVGVERAESKIVLLIDADLPTELTTLPVFYRLVKEGADFVFGTRSREMREEPKLRHILSTGFRLRFVSLFHPNYDTQCGIHYEPWQERHANVCVCATA